MKWNTNPTTAEVADLILHGRVECVYYIGADELQIDYADGRVLRVSPQDGRVYSERSVDSATINYTIGTPESAK